MWRALTDVGVVTTWAGVTPVRIPRNYPAAGQHAVWRDGALLHDYILDVEPERRLRSRLTQASAHAVEEYTLQPLGRGATRLHATWLGHPALAVNDVAISRLKEWCEGTVR